MTTKTVIQVLTSPRPKGISYLRATLEGLDREGADLADGKFVICDGPMDSDLKERAKSSGWTVIEKSGPSGVIAGFFEMVSHAVNQQDARLLYFEDDILPCKNAVRRMLKQQVPEDSAFISFFDMRAYPKETAFGLYPTPAAGGGKHEFWGLQAILFSTQTLIELNQLRSMEKQMASEWRGSPDNMLGHFIYKKLLSKDRYACHIPCLVQHVGNTSSLNHPFIVGTNFPGENFDAETLPEFQSKRYV